MTPALVLLDRDGTLNVKPPEGEYVTRPEGLVLLDGAAAAVARLNAAGVRVALVTNQRGIALGRMTEDDLRDVHARLAELLAAEGARLDALHHCPHDEGCPCRKPAPGMLERELREAGVAPGDTVMVGDSDSDVEAGRRAGVRTVRLGAADDPAADETAPDLAAAVDRLLVG